uniref:Uncharacterized protein n=1 Tax=Trichuris muris TaxID=70415 RepID=A0A5S6QHT4_TRIMR
MNGRSQRSSKPLPNAIHRHKEVDGRKTAASSSTCETSLSKLRQGRKGLPGKPTEEERSNNAGLDKHSCTVELAFTKPIAASFPCRDFGTVVSPCGHVRLDVVLLPCDCGAA